MPRKVRLVPDEMRDVGARIVGARKELGLNQAELAARANVDATVLNRVEKRGLEDPTAGFVLRIAKALGCTTDVLLTGHSMSAPVTLLAEPGVPRDLVDATAREIAAHVVRLIPARQGDGWAKNPSTPRKPRGSKRHARKA